MFHFEEQSSEGLAYIPLSVRFHLDASGCRISLAQWQALPLSEREAVCALPVPADSREATRACVARLSAALQAAGETPLAQEREAPLSHAGAGVGEDARELPAAVARQAALHRVAPPTAQAWCALDRFQRYALIKLSRRDTPNHDFLPALREFGLLSEAG